MGQAEGLRISKAETAVEPIHQLNQANTNVKVKSYAKQLSKMQDTINDIEKLTNDALKND